jgi:hypothetical protein
MLIRRFDGFRRLMRHAAGDCAHPLTFSDDDLLLANRTLAALGGPPASAEVRGQFSPDGLPLLLLFLLSQEFPCRAGLLGGSASAITRMKGLIQGFSYAAATLSDGAIPFGFHEVVRELGETGAMLHPCIAYDPDGEPKSIQPTGAPGVVRVGREGGPYTLAVLSGGRTGPAPLQSPNGPLHPAVLIMP